MGDRGAYRAIKTVLQDGPDFQELSERARHAFLTLKLAFGPSGIEVAYPGALEAEVAAKTGMPVEAASGAVVELQGVGWIEREGNVVWIVGQLEHDPHMSPDDEKHRASIWKHVAGLPRLGIVGRFVAHYSAWFEARDVTTRRGDEKTLDPAPDHLLSLTPPKAHPRPIQGPTEAPERPIEAPSTEYRVPNTEYREPRTETPSNGERSTEGGSPAAWMHAVWQEKLGYESHPLELTPSRKQKYEAMYREQLADTPDPEAAWRAVLYAVTRSEHHMSNRSYQMPESLLVNADRRSRWVQQTISVLENGASDADRRFQQREADLLEYLRERQAS